MSDYVTIKDAMDVPTEVAALRMYIVLLMRAADATGRECEVLRDGMYAMATFWPETIDKWCKDMGLPPSKKVPLSDAQSNAEAMRKFLSAKHQQNGDVSD